MCVTFSYSTAYTQLQILTRGSNTFSVSVSLYGAAAASLAHPSPPSDLLCMCGPWTSYVASLSLSLSVCVDMTCGQVKEEEVDVQNCELLRKNVMGWGIHPFPWSACTVYRRISVRITQSASISLGTDKASQCNHGDGSCSSVNGEIRHLV